MINWVHPKVANCLQTKSLRLYKLNPQGKGFKTVRAGGHRLCSRDFQDVVGELTEGSDPSPTPPLRGEGLSDSPFPAREGGWGVRFSEFANSIFPIARYFCKNGMLPIN